MAKQQNVTWSDPHSSKSNPQEHRDVHSQSSDSSKNPKVGHANVDTGSDSGDSGSGNGDNTNSGTQGE